MKEKKIKVQHQHAGTFKRHYYSTLVAETSHVRYGREPAMEIMAITFCYYKITVIIIESSTIIGELEIRTPRTRGKMGNNR